MINRVEITGVDTSKLQTLKNKEMMELLVMIKAGDNAAREKLIVGNIKLILSVLKKFNNRGENLDDLFQVGCVGLIKAIDNFDMSHGVRFSTYAVPMIIGEIRRYLRDSGSIRVSRSLKDIAYKSLKIKERYLREVHREPTVKELAKELEVEEIDVIMAFEAIQEPISMFTPIYNDGGDTIHLIDQIRDKTDTESKNIEEIMIKESLNRLEKREKSIIMERYFLGKTQMEIASEIGISQAQVSRLEKSALKHMSEFIG
ncbi:RNA polymerase sporulation sigma factor SigG [Mycoplasmatota bacterium WC44]